MEIIFLPVAFFLMEFVAWATHKYIMHGFLWKLHQDHHQKEGHSFFERNDSFFLIFAIPGIILLLTGSLNQFDYRFWAGAGITLYGFTYFFLHDVYIHRRFGFLKKIDNAYLRAVRKAHKVHHKKLGKHDGECFGMLVFPMKYLKEAFKTTG